MSDSNIQEEKKHRYVEEFKRHGDYAMEILDSICCNAFVTRTKKLETDYGLEIDYVVKQPDETGKIETKPFHTKIIGTYFFYLPVLLAYNVQKKFNILFPKEEYPIGFVINPPNYPAAFATVPFIKNISKFAALQYILNHETIDFIDKTFIKTLMPNANINVSINLDKNERLKEMLVNIVKSEDIKKIQMDLTPTLDKYNLLLNASIENKHADLTELRDEQQNFEYNNYSLLMEQVWNVEIGQYVEPRFINLSTNEEDLHRFQKPDLPPDIRYIQMIKKAKQDAENSIHTAGGKLEFSY